MASQGSWRTSVGKAHAATTLRAALVTHGIPTADLPVIDQLANRESANPTNP